MVLGLFCQPDFVAEGLPPVQYSTLHLRLFKHSFDQIQVNKFAILFASHLRTCGSSISSSSRYSYILIGVPGDGVASGKWWSTCSLKGIGECGTVRLWEMLVNIHYPEFVAGDQNLTPDRG